MLVNFGALKPLVQKKQVFPLTTLEPKEQPLWLVVLVPGGAQQFVDQPVRNIPIEDWERGIHIVNLALEEMFMSAWLWAVY